MLKSNLLSCPGILTLCACALLAAPPAIAQEPAQKSGLTEEDRATLEKRKILITNQAFKQIFQPYLSSPVPFFITSDSLLNAFHVLYEESVLQMETANAGRLPRMLEFIWGNLATIEEHCEDGDGKLVKKAKRRAQIIIGTALRLLGNDTFKAKKDVDQLIGKEVEKILAAQVVAKPAWLGPPDPGFVALDYSRYKPRGFYTRSEKLQQYFRAVSWLQSIPFRISKDEELVSILMLGNCITYGRFDRGALMKEMEYHDFLRAYASFIGNVDDWDLLDAAQEAQNDIDIDNLERKRERLVTKASGYGEGPLINDQIAFAPDDPEQTAEVTFRILSPYRTPDAILFQRTTDLRTFQRPFPSGLEVCAALGSVYARDRLTYGDRKLLLATIDECKKYFSGDSLYFDYLDCLRALLDEPEPDAPAFMSTEPWQIKSCQSVLSGWAQLRHTWALQAKQTVHYLGMTMPPAGFVEPEPDFFSRMARMAERAETMLREAGAFEVGRRAFANDLRAAARLIEEKGKGQEGMHAFFGCLSREEQMLINGPFMVLSASGLREPDELLTKGPEMLEELAIKVESGAAQTDATLSMALEMCTLDIEPLWERLITVCRRLEALAHKQLRGVPFSRDEDSFLNRYGSTLAGIMLYGGNAYLTPRDDAPRIVDVFYNPNAPAYLEVGIARPRAMYVLYPTAEGEVLCRGAVMPYYEFRHDARLTDKEWKQLLDSESRPAIPEWIRPVLGADGIGKAVLPEH